MAKPVKVYDSSVDAWQEELAKDVDAALSNTARPGGGAGVSELDIDFSEADFDGLIGIDRSVYQQIFASLKSGKQHLMFYGPPGTGKTTLARLTAGMLSPQWKLITASADWTSQDIVGGYMPLQGGRLQFFPGVLLENFDRPLIIDEMNRCDIDKVIGPLFTVLSGQDTTLPYLIDPEDPRSQRYVIHPSPKGDCEPHEFAPSEAWRLIGTLNTVDKGALFQMSYALSRRFAWVFVDVPESKSGFMREWLRREGLLEREVEPDEIIAIAQVWEHVCAVRPLGPAPAIDMARFAIAHAASEFQFIGAVESSADPRTQTLLDGFLVFFLPMLDGISSSEAGSLCDGIAQTLQLDEPRRKRLQDATRAISV
jgi:5-methylcytosine-specific restriction protein B